ncbi:MAG TPA: DNA polymerase III subunit delta [Bacteroidales bacterium]|nr:DNA polymerase III subunit delta [Bacteroidales bacterium]
MAKKRTSVEAYAEIISDLKKKIYKPVYFLTGDESYYIDMIADYIAENVLEESEKAFNQSILFGKDLDVPAIINAARRFPMMSNYQVIIVKEAQNIKKIEELEIYLKAPLKTTILVICQKLKQGDSKGKSDKSRKLMALVEKIGILFESKKLYDSQIPAWITQYLAEKGISIAPVPANLLNEFLGNDLSKISNELEKLIITLPLDNKKITVEHIERNIGLSKDFNRFELTKSLGERDILKVNRIADYFAKNPSSNPMVLTLTAIYQYYVKIFRYHFLKDKSASNIASELGVNPYFIDEYKNAARIYNPRKCVEVFSMLREYDMRAKGLNNDSTEDGELLRELVFKIMH